MSMAKESYRKQIDEMLKDLDTEHALLYGINNADAFSEDELLEKLSSDYIIDQFIAFGAIQKKKLLNALPVLRNMALYHEDISIREEAILTIRKIGGRVAGDMLKFLKTTEHREFIEETCKI